MPIRTLAVALGAALAVTVSGLVYAAHHEEIEGNIVEVATATGSFDTLIAALQATDLVSTLEGDGPFTVFAPTDEAFAKLPAGTVEALLQPENKQKLSEILTYHVVPGKVMASDVVKLDSAKTVNGKMLDIDASGGRVRVNGVNLVVTDFEATNGVIHVVDAVILPE